MLSRPFYPHIYPGYLQLVYRAPHYHSSVAYKHRTLSRCGSLLLFFGYCPSFLLSRAEMYSSLSHLVIGLLWIAYITPRRLSHALYHTVSVDTARHEYMTTIAYQVPRFRIPERVDVGRLSSIEASRDVVPRRRDGQAEWNPTNIINVSLSG